MKLPPEAITELQAIFSQQWGEQLDDVKAQEVANDILELFQLAQGDATTLNSFPYDAPN